MAGTVAPGFEPVRERVRGELSARRSLSRSRRRAQRVPGRAMRRRPVGRTYGCGARAAVAQGHAAQRVLDDQGHRRHLRRDARRSRRAELRRHRRERVARVRTERQAAHHHRASALASGGIARVRGPHDAAGSLRLAWALRRAGKTEATLGARREDRVSPDHVRLSRRRDRAARERPQQSASSCSRSSRRRSQRTSSSGSSLRCTGAWPKRWRRKT